MKQKTEPTKFKFGRNPLSLIIIIAAVGIVILVTSIIYSYSSTWNNYNVTPFETYYSSTDKEKDSTTVQEKKAKRLSTSLPSNITDLKKVDSSVELYKMNGKDFDLFDLEINCKNYTNTHAGNDQAAFEFTIKWTDKTTEQLGTNSLIPFDTDVKNDIKLTSCFAADWVGFCMYQTGSTTTKIVTKDPNSGDEADTSYTGATFNSTISGLDYFPTKAKTFPVNIDVKTPDLFIYIEFMYQHNGSKTRIYVLKYTFDEYNPNAKAGGIYSK